MAKIKGREMQTQGQHTMGNEVYLPSDSIGSDSKVVREEYLAIP